MSYVKTNWVNGETKLNATNMNKIENELESLDYQVTSQEENKANKPETSVAGDIAKLDSNGNSLDSGYQADNILLKTAVPNGIMKGDGAGNITAAIAGTDYITSHQDISNKANKPAVYRLA